MFDSFNTAPIVMFVGFVMAALGVAAPILYTYMRDGEL